MLNDPDPFAQAVSDYEFTRGHGKNLADIILEKIAAHEAAQAGKPKIHGGGLAEDAIEVPTKAVEAFSKYVWDYWQYLMLSVCSLLRIATGLDCS